ncbi:DUF3265 domain-containing protein [Vibrio parahaemolyticus]|nr:DUF3265 domain-containing protein [Vibrio parahaemolyticus]
MVRCKYQHRRNRCYNKQFKSAWHFYYAFVLVVKVVCGSIGIACLTP